MDYKKYTYGFVTQTFSQGKCVEQHFVGGDQVEYEEHETSEPIDAPGDETYCPFLMNQPK